MHDCNWKKKKKDTLKVLKSSTNYWCLKFRIQLCILHPIQREQVLILELGFHKDAGGIMLLHFWIFYSPTWSGQPASAWPESGLPVAPSRLSRCGSWARAPMLAPCVRSWIVRRHLKVALRGLLEKGVLCCHLPLKSMVSSPLMSYILIFASNDHSKHPMLHSGKIINWFTGKCKLKALFHTKTQFTN